MHFGKDATVLNKISLLHSDSLKKVLNWKVRPEAFYSASKKAAVIFWWEENTHF